MGKASSLLFIHPEIISLAVMFRAMVPFMPENVPNLSRKNIFIGAGQYDPIVPHKQAETLFGLFKKAGANAVLHFQENSGHKLGYGEIFAAKNWSSNIPRNSP